MLIRYARHIAIVAVLVLSVGGVGRLGPSHAASLAQAAGAADIVAQADTAENPATSGGRPAAPGETVNPYGCAAILSGEPIGSPAIAEGDLGAAGGPGTAGSGMLDLSVNTNCPPLPD